MRQSNSSRGSALLTALFIMTLVAIVATAMVTRVQLDIYRAQLLITHDKQYLASQAVIFWAIDKLGDKKIKLTRLRKHKMVARYPKTLRHIEPHMSITGGIYDLQAQFNLNNLIEKKSIPNFIFLLDQQTPNMSSNDKLNLAMALRHWIMPYTPGRGNDTYTNYYLTQNPPYYASNQLMRSPSEFRLVKDLSQSLYLSLEPFITAIPEHTPININTASKEVLMTLGNGLKENQANDLILARSPLGIKKLSSINELLNKLNINKEEITLQSHYFKCIALVKTKESTLKITALFKREKDKKGVITVSLIQQFLEHL